jgi:hypothetical protein
VSTGDVFVEIFGFRKVELTVIAAMPPTRHFLENNKNTFLQMK